MTSDEALKIMRSSQISTRMILTSIINDGYVYTTEIAMSILFKYGYIESFERVSETKTHYVVPNQEYIKRKFTAVLTDKAYLEML